MYFKDCITSKSEWTSYEDLLATLSMFLDDCVGYLMDVYRVVERVAAQDRRPHHATLTLLTRHVCEFIDGVSALTIRGCAEPCKPLLRSAFEALISVCYILETDTEQRALAYQVVHAKKKIKLYRKMMPQEEAGKELRRTIQSDSVGSRVNLPVLDFQKMIDNLKSMFLRPEYASIEQAWQTAKKRSRGDPPWFSLFGGPSSIRALAVNVGHAAWYELLYREWSDAVHAGGVFDNIALAADGQTVLRPLRHPEGLQAAVSLAAGICFSLTRRLLEHYAPDREEQFRSAYVRELRQRFLELSNKRPIIEAPWK